MSVADSTRGAFTLAEVLIALVVLTAGVLAVVGLFPAGIRVQQQARAQLYAAAIASTIADAMVQHDKTFHGRLHTIPAYAPANPGRSVLAGGIYGSRTRPDAEIILSAGGDNGFYPVPSEIARRLDSPDDLIRQVLDAGGTLFYPDPRPIRGLAAGAAALASAEQVAPEMQRLVFAFVGPAQQNALPQHPMAQPWYEIYPFPPQGLAWDAQNTNVESWRVIALPEWLNWEYLGQSRFRSDHWPDGAGGCNPWQDGLVAFRSLILFGFLPIDWKYTIRNSQRRFGTAISDPGDGAVSITGGAAADKGTYWLQTNWANNPAVFRPTNGQRLLPAVAAREALAADRDGTIGANLESFKDFIEAPASFGFSQRPWPASTPYADFNDLFSKAIGDPALPHPNGWLELGTRTDPRLVSYRFRCWYRLLALKLWADVARTDPDIRGLNPLEDDLWNATGTQPKPRWLHPARVLALSHLAHAAMLVTGHKAPYHEPQATAGTQPNGGWNTMSGVRDFGLSVSGEVDATVKLPGGRVAPGGADDAEQASAQDEAWALRAHENALRWAVAYANDNPHCTIVPKPANRPSMLDRGIYAWDPFDAAGNAQRSNAAAAPLPAYRVLPRLDIDTGAGSAQVPLHGPGGWLQRMEYNTDYTTLISRWEALYATFNQDPARATRLRLAQPFSPQARMRQLVFWSVDWKSYEDAETAPSAAWDAATLNRDSHYMGMSSFRPSPNPASASETINVSMLSWREFDPPEAPLTWFGRDRRYTFAQAALGLDSLRTDTTTAYFLTTNVAGEYGSTRGSTMPSIRDFVDREGLNHAPGQFGADRNGNGRLDAGGPGAVRAGTRLRAAEVARFPVYDPAVWLHLRR